MSFREILLYGTPSTTSNGVSPRNLRVGAVLNSVLLVTFKPATLPVSEVAILTGFTVDSLLPPTFWTAYPNAFSSRLIPKAVTTTSSIISASSAILIFNKDFPFTATSCCWYPIKETISTPLVGTSNLKLPSTSVIVPVPWAPFNLMLAPIIGSPAVSTIVPETKTVFFFCWGDTAKDCTSASLRTWREI